jgi:outer membrane protein
MRHRWVFGLIVVAVLTAQSARAEVKLAYVDVQRALNQCESGKQAKADFQSRVQSAESKLERQQSQVQALKNELEKKGMLMNPDQRQNLEDQYQQKLTDFQRAYKDSRDELQRRDSEMTGRIVHDLAQVIRTLGERDGYTMVMEKGSILWGAPTIDITDQVIRTYNSMHVKPGTLGEAPGAKQRATAMTPGSFGSTVARHSTISK